MMCSKMVRPARIRIAQVDIDAATLIGIRAGIVHNHIVLDQRFCVRATNGRSDANRSPQVRVSDEVTADGRAGICIGINYNAITPLMPGQSSAAVLNGEAFDRDIAVVDRDDRARS